MNLGEYLQISLYLRMAVNSIRRMKGPDTNRFRSLLGAKGGNWLLTVGIFFILLGVTSTVANGNGGSVLLNSFITVGDEGEHVVLPPPGSLSASADAAAGLRILLEPGPQGSDDSPAVVISGTDVLPALTQEQAPTIKAVVAYTPDRIRIPSIGLDTYIVPVRYRLVELDGQEFQQWLAPDEYAAGWHDNSAPLNVPGNTVLNGHNNIFGEVFSRLAEMEPGDKIMVYSGVDVFTYEVTNKMILKEKYESVETRSSNAQWLQKSDDERLTLVTCWPNWSNTHRLIVVAKPYSHHKDYKAEQ